MGGNRNRKELKLRAQCAHSETLTTITAGIERSVCETCGHLSMQYVSEFCSPVERETFARQIDEMHAANERPIVDLTTAAATVTVHPFAERSREDEANSQTVKRVIDELAVRDDGSWRDAAGGRGAYRVARTHKVSVGA